jgi:hypothetical protein
LPNCKSIFDTVTERMHVRQSTRFQQIRDATYLQFVSCKIMRGENSGHSDTSIKGACTIVCTVKKWVAQFITEPSLFWREREYLGYLFTIEYAQPVI